MPVVWSDRCLLHEPAAEIWVGTATPAAEMPARATAILEALDARVVEAQAHDDSALLEVHDEVLLAYLASAWQEWSGAGLPQEQVVPYVFAHRELGRAPASGGGLGEAGLLRLRHDDARRPGNVGGGARGRRRGADGRRPRARRRARRLRVHAPAWATTSTRSAYGGSCYLNNAAIAAAGARRSPVRSRCSTSTRITATAPRRSSAGAQRSWIGSVHVDPAAGWFPHFLGFADESDEVEPATCRSRPGSGDEPWLEAVAELVELGAWRRGPRRRARGRRRRGRPREPAPGDAQRRSARPAGCSARSACRRSSCRRAATTSRRSERSCASRCSASRRAGRESSRPSTSSTSSSAWRRSARIRSAFASPGRRRSARQSTSSRARCVRSACRTWSRSRCPSTAGGSRRPTSSSTDGTRVEAASFGGVPETGAKGVAGELVRVGRGGRRQLDRLDVGGKVALVEWQVARLWPYHVGLELGLRGAKAMVVYAPEGGPFYQAPGALGTFDGIWHAEGPPCVTVRREDAPKLGEPRSGSCSERPAGRAPAGTSSGSFPVEGEARRPIVAGHHDGWFQAAFDDATGVAVTLELARAFTEAGVRPSRTIAFVSHTAEEYGIAESAYDWCYGAWYQVVAEHPEWTTGSPFYLNVEGSGRRGDVFSARRAARAGRAGSAATAAPPSATACSRTAGGSTGRTRGPRSGRSSPPGSRASTSRPSPTSFDRTEYHTQFDTADKVDFEYLAKLTELCGAAAARRAGARLRSPRPRAGGEHGARASCGRALGDERRSASPRSGAACTGSTRSTRRATRTSRRQADVEHLERALADPARRRAPPRAGRAQLALRRPFAPGVPDRARSPRPARPPRLLGRDGRRRSRARTSGASSPRSAASRGPAARPVARASLRRHLERSRRELGRRLDRMEQAAAGRVFPLPRPRAATFR